MEGYFEILSEWTLSIKTLTSLTSNSPILGSVTLRGEIIVDG